MTIVFVCTGNTCRSPMAAALMRQVLDKRGRRDIMVTSAGLAAAAGQPAARHAVEAMRECGADLSAHRARPIDDTLLCGADCFAVMSASHAAALAAYGVPPELVHVLAAQSGGIPDPYGGSLDDYRRTRDILNDAVEALAAQCRL